MPAGSAWEAPGIHELQALYLKTIRANSGDFIARLFVTVCRRLLSLKLWTAGGYFPASSAEKGFLATGTGGS